MKAVLFFLSLLAVTVTMAQPITRAEYFFDTDPGFGNGTAIAVTPGPVVDLNFNASVAGLETGIHTLFIRTKSVVWSQVHTRLVGVSPNAGITRAEYFFDTDPGFGNGTAIAVTPGKVVDLNFNANTEGLNPGVHSLFIRTKSVVWSQVHTRLVGVSPDAGITRAEYFTGTDPGYGNGIPITVTPGKLVVLDVNLENLNLSDGVNYIYFRTYAGFWSQTYAHEYCRNCTSVLIQNDTVREGERRCYEEVETIVTGGDGTGFLVESGATVNLVAEQNVRMRPGTHFKQGSGVHVLIGSGGTYCLNHMSKSAAIVEQADEQPEELRSFSAYYRIYPNPTSGVFTLELREAGLSSQISVDIFNSIGEKMRHEEVSIYRQYNFDISDLPGGIYFIKVLGDGIFDMAKTIIKR
jgi:hypothetical protein